MLNFFNNLKLKLANYNYYLHYLAIFQFTNLGYALFMIKCFLIIVFKATNLTLEQAIRIHIRSNSNNNNAKYFNAFKQMLAKNLVSKLS